jgi:hypothetical protein
MTCGATPHGCGHREAFVNVNDAATGGVRGTERAVLGWGQVGRLVQNMPRPTKHHDLLEYMSSQMIFEERWKEINGAPRNLSRRKSCLQTLEEIKRHESQRLGSLVRWMV